MQGIIKAGGLVVTYDRDKNMIIEAPEAFREELRQLKKDSTDFDSDGALHGLLEGLVCNSELQWIDPVDCPGDLTDAPILGILGEETREQDLPAERFGKVWCAHDERGNWFQPIMARWAFMSYETISLQEQLLQEGRATLVSQH